MRCGSTLVELLGDVGLARQGEDELLEGRVERRVAQHVAHRGDEVGVERRRLAAAHRGEQAVQGQALAGFPAVERIAVVAQQDQQVGVAEAVDEDHRRREAAQQREHRRLVDVDEGEERRALRRGPARATSRRRSSGSSSRRSGSARPSRPTRPIASGITKGSCAVRRRGSTTARGRACRCATARRSGRARSPWAFRPARTSA